MACFWKDLLAATQVCDLGGAVPGESEFASGGEEGSSGGFLLRKSSWTSANPNLIEGALDAAADVEVIGYVSGEAVVPVDPPVLLHYSPTGFGPDPEDAGDFRILQAIDSEWNGAGLPMFEPVLIQVDFPGGTAFGTVTAVFGS